MNMHSSDGKNVKAMDRAEFHAGVGPGLCHRVTDEVLQSTGVDTEHATVLVSNLLVDARGQKPPGSLVKAQAGRSERIQLPVKNSEPYRGPDIV